MKDLDHRRVQFPIDLTNIEYVSVQDETEKGLHDYWKMLVKRRRLVVLVFVAVLAVASYLTFAQTPLYSASATLKIEAQAPTVARVDEVLLQDGRDDGPYSYYQTQFSLLQSRPLAAQVITELGLETNVAFNQDISSPLKRLKSRIEKFFTITISSITRFFHEPPVQEKAHHKAPHIGDQHPYGVPPHLIGRYKSFLSVRPVNNTRLVQVQFTTPDPSLSKELADAHAVAFVRSNLETRFELTKEARKFLDRKLTELKTKVQNSESVLQQFRQMHGVVSIEGDEKIMIDRMTDLNRRLTEARAKRIELESLYRIVENKNHRSLSQVINNNQIQQIKSRLSQLSETQARLSVTFTPEHPRLVELNQEMSEVRQSLEREISTVVRSIEGDYAAARAEEETLQAEASRQQKAALALKELGVKFAVLQSEVTASRTLHDAVLKRLNETNVSSNIALSNFEIVEQAETPLAPSSPNIGRNLLLASTSGLFLGVGLAIFLGFWDSTVNTAEEVKRAVALPTLGIVPQLHLSQIPEYGYGDLSKQSLLGRLTPRAKTNGRAHSHELVIFHHPFSIFAESFRAIRTTLLSHTDSPLQAILFTSAHPRDGKTLSLLNLAITLAQGGHTVVVVDADLRKGTCHAMLGQKNLRGLTNVLTGDLTVEQCLQETPMAGLSLLPRGPIPSNPADLLSSHRIRELLPLLCQRFDFVLVDAPPMIGVSDAAILAQLCDGVVLIMRGQKTTIEAARYVVSSLEAVRARILGVVLNGVDMHDPDYKYYREYYKAYYTTAQTETEDQR
jgi:capsular exopolysaccharide synthesis family protein